MKVSPKAIAAFAVPVVASLCLWAITGSNEWLIGVLGGFVSGGGAIAAPPAPGVTQLQVARLSRQQKGVRKGVRP